MKKHLIVKHILFITLSVFLFVGCNSDSNTDEKNPDNEKTEKNEAYKNLLGVDSAFINQEKAYKSILNKYPDSLEIISNLAILYYNEGLKQINQTDSAKYMKLVTDPNMMDIPIQNFFFSLSFDDIEGKTYALMNLATQYFEKAYAIDPNSKNTIIGLAGCYFMQREDKKYEEILSRADSLNIELE